MGGQHHFGAPIQLLLSRLSGGGFPKWSKAANGDFPNKAE